MNAFLKMLFKKKIFIGLGLVILLVLTSCSLFGQMVGKTIDAEDFSIVQIADKNCEIDCISIFKIHTGDKDICVTNLSQFISFNKTLEHEIYIKEESLAQPEPFISNYDRKSFRWVEFKQGRYFEANRDYEIGILAYKEEKDIISWKVLGQTKGQEWKK